MSGPTTALPNETDSAAEMAALCKSWPWGKSLSADRVKDGTSTTLPDYAGDSRKAGFRVIEGESGCLWVQHGPLSMVRFPTFCMTEPSPRELERVQRKSRLPIASYVVAAPSDASANAFLYLLAAPYDSTKLHKKEKQSLTRASKYLQIQQVDWDTFAVDGFPAFRDTRTRARLDDGRPEVFQREQELFRSIRGHAVLGAWKGSELVAFLMCLQVDDCCELTLSCSTNGSLAWCPNNALYNRLFELYINEQRCRLVSAGLSSVQLDERSKGLHAFKTSVGFQAIPVRRVMAIHPLVRPLLNPITHRLMTALSSMLPRNRHLRKGAGALGGYLSNF